MIRIAVCDDEVNICSGLESCIQKYMQESLSEYDMEVFYTGEEICKNLQDGNKIDLVFLDIELPKISGVDVGRYIRETLNDEVTDIVYISSKTSYAMELFKCRPIDFLIKPLIYQDVKRILDIVIKRNHIKHRLFEAEIDKGVCKFLLMDILYFYSDNKKVHIKMRQGEDLEFTDKLDNVEKRLPAPCFLRIHKSYLINYEYVMQYRTDSVIMINQDKLTISKAYRTEVKQKLIRRESGTGIGDE